MTKLKPMISLVISLLLCTTVSAMNIAGQWRGNLEVGQQSVPIVFNVTQLEESLSATMDSPAQGATNIPVKSVEVSGKNVVFTIAVAGAVFEALLTENTLAGTWKQSGQSFPLTMNKGEVKAQVKKN